MIVAESHGFADLVGFPQWPAPAEGLSLEVHGTTVLALRFDQGVVMLADRRATAGSLIMYDQADKILPLDDHTLAAISGAYGRSVEVCRYLKHSLKYYSRMVLHEMSLDGKLMEISKALSANMANAMQGVGLFLPIVAAYDRKADAFGVYFFDGAGARFENGTYACAGSGSERIRGVFEYLGRTKKPWTERPLNDVMSDGLLMLDIASDLDSATGGFTKDLPVVRVLDREGNHLVSDQELRKAAKEVLRGVLV